MDLFAGKGSYTDRGQKVNGSPLIFLDGIAKKRDSLKDEVTIKLFLVDCDKSIFACLKENINEYITNNPDISDIVDVIFINDDCNKVIGKIISQIKNTSRHPLLTLIDPWGIKINNATVERIAGLENPKDIIFNYILEGVRRAGGVVAKAYSKAELSLSEEGTVKTFTEFRGSDVNIVDEYGSRMPDVEILEKFCEVFTSRNFRIVAYDMEYPDRKDVLYYLLFASRKQSIAKIIIDIYARQKSKNSQPSLFGREFDRDGIIRFIQF